MIKNTIQRALGSRIQNRADAQVEKERERILHGMGVTYINRR